MWLDIFNQQRSRLTLNPGGLIGPIILPNYTDQLFSSLENRDPQLVQCGLGPIELILEIAGSNVNDGTPLVPFRPKAYPFPYCFPELLGQTENFYQCWDTNWSRRSKHNAITAKLNERNVRMARTTACAGLGPRVDAQ
jgi:hypothetical protein